MNRRLAMLSIDNAVELMMKTYLGLPTRETGIDLSKAAFESISESFSKILGAIERLAPERLAGVDPTSVEWFHRLRNQLYHEGNGLTVERDKIATYAALAKILFKNLFKTDLGDIPDIEGSEMITEYLKAYDQVQDLLLEAAEFKYGANYRGEIPTAKDMVKWGYFDQETAAKFMELEEIRNRVAHGESTALTWRHLNFLQNLYAELFDRI